MYSQISFDKKMLSNSEERNLKYIKKLNIYFFFSFRNSAWNDIGLSVDRTLYSNNDLF